MREGRGTFHEAGARRGALRRRASVGALAALAVFAVLVAGTPAAAQSSDRPPPPEGLSVTTVTHSSVTLSWRGSSDGSVIGYQVLRRDRTDGATSAYVSIAELRGSSIRSFVDYGVSPSSTYFYRIKARSPAGLSEWSAHVRADTPAAPPGSFNFDKQPLPVSDNSDNKDPAQGSVGQRSSHDETPPTSVPPSQPTASASGPSDASPDDSDGSEGEQETQPPPTAEERKNRLVVRVAPSE